jgi:hypothetical protein
LIKEFRNGYQNIGGKNDSQTKHKLQQIRSKIFFMNGKKHASIIFRKEKLSFDWPIKIQSTVKSFLLTENWLIIKKCVFAKS